jgi:hypothetical protein
VRTGSGRRRLRLRRKRKDGSLSDVLGPRKAADVADDSKSFGREAAEEVVFETGCCVVEAIGSAAVLLALLTVPAYLLMR